MRVELTTEVRLENECIDAIEVFICSETQLTLTSELMQKSYSQIELALFPCFELTKSSNHIDAWKLIECMYVGSYPLSR